MIKFDYNLWDEIKNISYIEAGYIVITLLAFIYLSLIKNTFVLTFAFIVLLFSCLLYILHMYRNVVGHLLVITIYILCINLENFFKTLNIYVVNTLVLILTIGLIYLVIKYREKIFAKNR